MKRNVLALLGVALLLAAIGWSISSQTEELELPDGYIRGDLQLISQESKDDWSPAWTGPIEAATILAWFREHGYSRFLRDFNGDGVIDELDTIELANIFGGAMRADTARGTTDARLVFGMAEYIANLYPGEFVLKIYDAGFPVEFASEGLGQFASDVIPGIELRLESEPTLPAYEYELETAEGVIVGLEDSEDGNTYLSGRSYLFEETHDGYTPVDLAWAEENRFEPGHQGRILETVAMTDDRFYIDYRMGWTPVEFMLALSPVVAPEFSSETYICPEDSRGYDVTVTPTPYGSVRIEECVTREGGFDTYTWTVTNIDFEWMGCGLCLFGVGNNGFTSVSHSGPTLWTFNEFPGVWVWEAPLGSCGIQAGQSGVFSVTVPGPTIDTWVTGVVQACDPPPAMPGTLVIDGGLRPPPSFWLRTTSPGEFDLDNCPDLTVTVVDQGCVFNPRTELWEISVWVEVANIEALAVETSFTVLLESDTYLATTTFNPPLPFPGGFSMVEKMVYTVSSATPPCPEAFTVTVDSGYAVVECLEDNNVAFGDVCCEGDQDDERGACCFRDGSCADTTASDCASEGGEFQGPGTVCDFTVCPGGPGDETGACCIPIPGTPSETCADLTVAECASEGGDFQGPGTSCDTTVCPGDDTCPDLIVEILANETTCELLLGPTGGAIGWELTMTALVTNIGDADATCDHIRVRLTCSAGQRVTTVGPIAAGDSEEVDATWTFGMNNPPDCPERLEADVDLMLPCVDECPDTNNDDSMTLRCPACK